MNTKLTALALIATAALTLAPKPAVAGDKELAVVGGIIGGLIIASAINDHYDDDRNVVYSSGDRCDTGYWNNVSVNVWVPGCWVVERSRHGHSHRRFVAGHYETRTNRVWVAQNRRDYRHERRDYRHERRDDRRDDRFENRHDRRDNRR